MKKTLNVYYKGTCQKIKYYGDIDIANTKEILKNTLNIKENPEQMFFQDEDGDPIILNKNIPSDLSVYLYIKPDEFPKEPEKALQINQKVAENFIGLKFHWINDGIGDPNHENTIILNKYIYKNKSSSGLSAGNVRSSISFTNGKNFFVIRVTNFPHYSYLKIVDEDKKVEFGNDYDINYTNIGLGGSLSAEYVESNKVYNIGILIDMDKKFCTFYDYDKQQKLGCLHDVHSVIVRDGKSVEINKPKGEPLEGKILSEKVKLVAWIKDDAVSENKGMTILNEGCIPLPDWLNI